MKLLSSLLFCCLLSPCVTNAEPLNDEAKETLLSNLKELLRGNRNLEKSTIAKAISTLSSVASDGDAIADLLEKCSQKRSIDDKNKNEKDKRKWRKDNKDFFNDPILKKALIYQCQWAILTLQAASVPEDSFDPTEYTSKIVSFIQSIASNYEELKPQKGALSASLLQGPIGEVLGVSGIRPKEWPENIMDVGSVFETIIFPPLRKSMNSSGLRNAWEKRIKFEAIFSGTVDEEEKQKDDNERGKRKTIKTLAASKGSQSKLSESAVNAIEELRWKCELDCCKHGDESQAYFNMFNFIQKTKDVKKRAARIQELMNILTGKEVNTIKGQSLDDIISSEDAAETTAFGSTKNPASSTLRSKKRPVTPVVTPQDIEEIPIEEPTDNTPKKPIVAQVEEIIIPQEVAQETHTPTVTPTTKETTKETQSEPSSAPQETQDDDNFFD
ncbi:MAG: hypothetical protein RR506_08475 [Akkermansia sp.]